MKIIFLLVQFFLILLGSTFAIAEDFDPRKIYNETSKAVVVIAGFEKGKQALSKGTGSIISSDGLVLTNSHVIINEKEGRPFNNLRVFLRPEKITGNLKKDTSLKYKVEIVQFSEKLDLALLRIRSRSIKNMPSALNFSDSDLVSIGDPVLAIGHPEQGGLWTLTTGTISSHRMNYGNVPGKNVFQTEASLNRGNSGGPLIDGRGQIIGINSMISRRAEDGMAITGINFSIKSRVAVNWLDSIGVQIALRSPPPVKQLPPPLASNAGIVPIPKATASVPKVTASVPKATASVPKVTVSVPKVTVSVPKATASAPKATAYVPKVGADIPKAAAVILKEIILAPKNQAKNPQALNPKKANPKTSRILTKIRPFKDEDLLLQVEDEMEDMINEMKDKFN